MCISLNISKTKTKTKKIIEKINVEIIRVLPTFFKDERR